jgi:mycoredoxin
VHQEQDEVIIYWRPDCVFCLDLLLRLKFTRLRYRKVDIRKDPGARALVRSVADGNETVPTVLVAGRALVNPSKRQLIGAVRAHAPHALGTPG